MEQTSKFLSLLTISELDEASYKDARRLFVAYKDKQVITNGLFEESSWALSDEYANVNFDFGISKKDFEEYESYLKMSVEDFVMHLKVYVIYRMGELALSSLRNMITQVRRLVRYPINRLEDISDDCNIDQISCVSEFFSMLPSIDRENELEKIISKIDVADETLRSSTQNNRRKLATFDSYFKFDDVITSFWMESDDESEKLFYFPLYIWWKVSAIIPMRPREVVLTPRKCIENRDGSWYLTILKNKLKGRGKLVSYKIEDDYIKRVYQIPDDLAQHIQWYIKATENFANNQLQTLFIADSHYAKWGKCKPYTSRFFTYINMATCLRYFYRQIVLERYGYSLVYERETSYLNSNEINYIYLGDTRHLSMINMIADGATPVVAMMLADHDNITVSAHYFSNIAEFIECKTYRQYSKLLHDKQKYTLSKPVSTFNVGEYITLDHNDRCYSKSVIKGDFTDCIKVAGPNGEIGFCPKCSYFWTEGSVFSDYKIMYNNRIKAECDNLIRIVNQVRSENGNEEDIIQALLKLQNAEYSYQQYLHERMRQEGQNGKA